MTLFDLRDLSPDDVCADCGEVRWPDPNGPCQNCLEIVEPWFDTWAEHYGER